MASIVVGSHPPEAWDGFVAEHPHGTPFHLEAWSRCVVSGLRTRARWLIAEQDGAIVGGLPLHHVRSHLFGARLSSSPQAAYGGPLAVDAAVSGALVAAAEAEAEKLGVQYLELRLRRPPETSCQGERWRESDVHVTIGGPIAADDEAILRAIPKKTRADCRKADAVLTAEESPRLFDTFRRLFAANQRDLGTPVLPTRFLRAVAESPELGSRVLVVRADGGEPVAACLSFAFRDRVLPYYAGAARDALPLRPNHGLYLNVLRAARRAGLEWYDFGRSKRGSGSYDFKRRWGFDETPLHYSYRLVQAEELPALNPQNPRFRRKIDAWKRLPHWVANLVGPLLSPGLS